MSEGKKAQEVRAGKRGRTKETAHDAHLRSDTCDPLRPEHDERESPSPWWRVQRVRLCGCDPAKLRSQLATMRVDEQDARRKRALSAALGGVYEAVRDVDERISAARNRDALSDLLGALRKVPHVFEHERVRVQELESAKRGRKAGKSADTYNVRIAIARRIAELPQLVERERDIASRCAAAEPLRENLSGKNPDVLRGVIATHLSRAYTDLEIAKVLNVPGDAEQRRKTVFDLRKRWGERRAERMAVFARLGDAVDRALPKARKATGFDAPRPLSRSRGAACAPGEALPGSQGPLESRRTPRHCGAIERDAPAD